MFPRNRDLIILLYILIDALCVHAAIMLACWLRQDILPPGIFPLTQFFSEANPYRFFFMSWVFVAILSNSTHDLYQTKRETSRSSEVWEVFQSVMLSSLVMIVIIYLSKVEGFPRTVLAMTVGFMGLLFAMWRVGKRSFVEYLVVRGYNNFNVLIIGAGKVGQALADEIEKRPGMGFQIIGFLDDFKTEPPPSCDVPVVGKLREFVGIARREFIHKIFITIHPDSQVFLRLLEEARQLGIAVRVVPQGFNLTTGDFCRYNIGLIPILEYGEMEFSRKQFGKRLFDFVISLAAVLVLLPVYAVLAIVIKLDSPGPVFYFSRRYGRRGNIFKMYKFRSMVSDADVQLAGILHQNEVDGPIFKIKNDPRVTRIGRFLRRFSLDELPQFLNVLKGEMSLVGPRPLPIEQIEKQDLKQLKRLEVRPGITGLWQIRGRSNLSFARLVRWDIWYINNWSFWLDLNILFMTVPAMLRCRGAY